MNRENNLLHQPDTLQQQPPRSSKPPKPLALSTAVLLSALVAGVGGYWLGMRVNQNVSQSIQRVSFQPSPTIIAQSFVSSPSPAPTQAIARADWKTYMNQKHSYQVKYPSDKVYEELPVSGYGYTNFLYGCFIVFVVPYGFDDKDLRRKTSIPWEELNVLEDTKIGSTTVYQIDERKIGTEGQFTLKYSYKKLPDIQIGGLNWNAFQITNNWENHTVHNIYFTGKDNKRYLIDMRSYGPCYEDEPVEMLSTFSFIN